MPAYAGKSNWSRKGTEPGTFDSAMSENNPIIARRPLFTSALRPRAFFSSDAFLKRLKGS